MVAERVRVYIDGFNLYFGLKESGWRRYYWLDVCALARKLLRPGQTLEAVRYFTARISGPQSKQARQATYLAALEERGGCDLLFGRYQSSPSVCPYCKKTRLVSQEKMTDVNIAVELLCDAFRDDFDVAVVVSGDADLVPAIRQLKGLFPGKRVVCAFPPRRSSKALQQVVDGHYVIGRAAFSGSQLPQTIQRKAGGAPIARPPEWR